jgi:hypothetical protein
MDFIPVLVDLKTLYQRNSSITAIVLVRFAGLGLGFWKISLPAA